MCFTPRLCHIHRHRLQSQTIECTTNLYNYCPPCLSSFPDPSTAITEAALAGWLASPGREPFLQRRVRTGQVSPMCNLWMKGVCGVLVVGFEGPLRHGGPKRRYEEH